MGFFCTAIDGLVRSRRNADAGTHVLLLDNGFSARANINTRTRLHVSTAHAQWEGLRGLQSPVKKGKIVGPLYRCWRQLITSS